MRSNWFSWILRLVAGVAALLLIGVAALWTVNSFVPAPVPLGVKDGHLAVCPDRPNCVSSQDERPTHHIDPIPFRVGRDAIRQDLKEAAGALGRTRVVTETGDYLHLTVRSRLCGFIDDLEFLIDGSNAVVQVRSASRLGYSDLGVNRARIEEIRQRLESRQGR